MRYFSTALLAFGVAHEKDGIGIYGSLMHYGLVIAFAGSAFMVFLYLWRKGRLDMDEAPKIQMMQEDGEKRDE